MGILVTILLAVVVIALMGWGAAALWFDGPASRPLAGLAAALFVVASLTVLLRWPRWRGLIAFAVLFVALLAWWWSIPARNDRDWIRDVRVTPTAELHGDTLTVHGVRNFSYRSETDWDERWEDRTYDLAKLRGLDLFMSYWGSPTIAHTIMSWDFEGSLPLAISIETRKEVGESYSAVRGFFRQYELYYVVADERDLVGLRTNHRGEQVFLYRFRAGPQFARALLLSYLGQINDLAEKPKWYNAATHNCTTTIRFHGMQAGIQNPLDWRLFLNGHLDELLYERGDIDTSRPFPEMRVHSDITARAKAAGDAPDFSMRIREGVPPRPPPRNAGRT
jgi:hypothetical protein